MIADIAGELVFKALHALGRHTLYLISLGRYDFSSMPVYGTSKSGCLADLAMIAIGLFTVFLIVGIVALIIGYS